MESEQSALLRSARLAFSAGRLDECVAGLHLLPHHHAEILRVRCLMRAGNYLRAFEAAEPHYWNTRRTGNDEAIAEAAMMLGVLSQRLLGFSASLPYFTDARAFVLGTPSEHLFLELLNHQAAAAVLSGHLDVADKLSALPLRMGSVSHRVIARITRSVVAQNRGSTLEAVMLHEKNLLELRQAPRNGYLMAHTIWSLVKLSLQIGRHDRLQTFVALADDYPWPKSLELLQADTYLDIAHAATKLGRKVLASESLIKARLASQRRPILLSSYALMARQAIFDERYEDMVDALTLLAKLYESPNNEDVEAREDIYLLIADLAPIDLNSAKFFYAKATGGQPMVKLRGPIDEERKAAVESLATGMILLASGNTTAAGFDLEVAFRHFQAFGIKQVAASAAIGLANITGFEFYYEYAAGAASNLHGKVGDGSLD